MNPAPIPSQPNPSPCPLTILLLWFVGKIGAEGEGARVSGQGGGGSKDRYRRADGHMEQGAVRGGERGNDV